MNKQHRKLTYMELEKMKGNDAVEVDLLGIFSLPTAEGKIRSVGVSNYEISHIEEIKSFSKVSVQEMNR